MTIDLTGKVAVVTGASRGIGKAAAEELARCGAKVVLLARSRTDVEDNAKAISASGSEAMGIGCDVTAFSAVSAAIKEAHSQFGGIDIVINNAGVIDPIAHLAESEPGAWSLAVDVNIKGVYYVMRAALPGMIARGGGTIVNLSSGAANSALEGWSHYCATKAAVKKLTEVAHKELAGKGVRVVGLSPGTVATDMMATIKESGINPVSQLDWSSHIPAEWAAKAVAFLCGSQGGEFAGTDFSIKTDEGRKRVGLPPAG